MRRCRDIFVVAVTLLVVTGLAQADLMPVSSTETGVQTDALVSVPDQFPAIPAYDLLLGLPGPSEWVTEAVRLPDGSDPQETAAESDVQVLADRSDSVDLCLYALIGLGVLRSGHWVKIPALGCIPEWYHTGGPDQIGHSHAVNPDCLLAADVCFAQPRTVADDYVALADTGEITALWRKSQFASEVLAARAPPCRTL